MITIITILFIAGLCKAIKDRLDNPYSKHAFPTKGRFWVKGTGNKLFGFYLDAWHFADLIYITCFCVLIAMHVQIIPYGIALNALLYLAITQTTFNIFYSLFKRK